MGWRAIVFGILASATMVPGHGILVAQTAVVMPLDNITVSAAQPTLPSGVRFDAPTTVNWDGSVPRRLRDMNPRSPSDAAVARMLAEGDASTYGTDVTFQLPVPPQLAARLYYLVSPRGVTPLRLDSLVGVVPYTLAFPFDTIVHAGETGGYVAASTSAESASTLGGFVLSADRPLQLTRASAALTPGDVAAAATDTSTTGRRTTGTAFWRIDRQFTLSVDGTPIRWVLVRLAADTQCVEVCCEFRYLLLEVNPPHRLVMRNEFGCDS
jgi:hypothetical protein